MSTGSRLLTDQIYDWLKEQIFVGVLEAGQRISVDSIANEIGVSRTPVRDALNRLSIEGLVVVSPRKGTVVATFDHLALEEVYQARRLLEPAICEEVAAEPSARFVDDLEVLQTEMEAMEPAKVYRDVPTTMRWVDLNARFHNRIAAETGNNRVIRMLEPLYMPARIAPVVFGGDYSGPESRIAEHRAILEAFSRRDGPAAREAMLRHLGGARRDVARFMESHGHTADPRNGGRGALKPLERASLRRGLVGAVSLADDPY